MVDLSAYRFHDSNDTFQKAFENANAVRLNRADIEAGRALGAGNYRGAAQTLYGAGDIANGQRVQQSGEARDAAALSAQRRRETVGRFSTGDTVGAQQDALATGDFDLLKGLAGLTADQRKEEQRLAEMSVAVGTSLLNLPPEQRRAAIDAQRDALKAQGLNDQAIDAIPLDDAGIRAGLGRAMTTKDILAAFHQDRQFGETVRHNKAGETTAQQNANTSAFSAQTGRMSYEARKAAGGFGTPGVGSALGSTLDPDEWEIQDAH